MDIIQLAVVGSSIGTISIILVYIYLYIIYRETFMGIWALSWLISIVAPELFLDSHLPVLLRLALVAWLLWQILTSHALHLVQTLLVPSCIRFACLITVSRWCTVQLKFLWAWQTLLQAVLQSALRFGRKQLWLSRLCVLKGTMPSVHSVDALLQPAPLWASK